MNNENNKPKDWWDKIRISGIFLSSIGIPVVIAVIGFSLNTSLKEKDIRFGMVKMAIEILKENPSDSKLKDLRDWSIKVVDEFSGVRFTKEQKQELKVEPLPKTIKFVGTGIAQQSYLPKEDIEEQISDYFEKAGLRIDEKLRSGVTKP